MHVSRHIRLGAAYSGIVSLLALVLSGCSHTVQAAGSGQPAQANTDPQQAAKVHFYQTEVLPTLQSNCLRCHGGMNRRGGLNMSTHAALMQGGKDGVVVIAGRPEDSLLVRVINP